MTFEQTSSLKSPANVVWFHATQMPSIQHELRPWMKMTYPAELSKLSLDDPRVVLGVPLFTSWILLGGWLPVERLRVTIVELDPGRRFVEQSGTLFMRLWRHERTVENTASGCQLTDRLSFEAPIGFFTPWIGWGLRFFFRRRHRALRLRFGAGEDVR